MKPDHRLASGKPLMTEPTLDRRLLLQAAAVSPLVAALAASQAIAADGSGRLVVIAELISRPDRADALRDLLVPFAEGSLHEPGCEHYTLLEDIHTPGRFLTYEIWTDQAALAAHMQTPAIKAAGAKLADILAKPFTQAMLKTLSTG